MDMLTDAVDAFLAPYELEINNLNLNPAQKRCGDVHGSMSRMMLMRSACVSWHGLGMMHARALVRRDPWGWGITMELCAPPDGVDLDCHIGTVILSRMFKQSKPKRVLGTCVRTGAAEPERGMERGTGARWGERGVGNSEN